MNAIAVRRAALVAAALFGLSRPALAQVTPAAGATPPDDTPTVKVGGVIYTDYTYTDEPTIKDADGNVVHLNGFNVSRAYINVTGNASHLIAFRVTGDVSRENGTGSTLAGSLNYRLKYAFGQLNLDDWLTHGSWIRIGQQQTPYIDYMEGIYRYRFQGTIYPEREGYMSSSDFGISGHYNFPSNYGDVHLGVYNGETYTKPEANNQKAFQIRGTLRPLAQANMLRGLRLTAFYDADKYVKNGARNRFIANATYEQARVNVGFDYLTTTDQTSATKPEVKGEGWGAWATPKFKVVNEMKYGFEALLRYEDTKPDKTINGHKKRFIGGLSYWFPLPKGTTAVLLADMEKVDYDTVLAKANEKRFSLHTQFTF